MLIEKIDKFWDIASNWFLKSAVSLKENTWNLFCLKPLQNACPDYSLQHKTKRVAQSRFSFKGKWVIVAWVEFLRKKKWFGVALSVLLKKKNCSEWVSVSLKKRKLVRSGTKWQEVACSDLEWIRLDHSGLEHKTVMSVEKWSVIIQNTPQRLFRCTCVV